MKRGLRLSFVAWLLCCFVAAGTAAAQESAGAPPSLALRVTAGGRLRTSFDPIPAGTGLTKWYTFFARTPSWKEPEGKLPILAVRFAYGMEGDRARVRVTIHRGVKFYDVEEFVAEYSAAAGESYVVSELAKFGVVPFKFDIVKMAAAASAPVSASYLTTSLEVVSAQVDDKSSTLKLLLHNRSPKPVMALKLQSTKGEMVLATMWPLGREGRPLVEAGGVGEVVMGYGGVGGVKTAEGYVPVSPDGVKVASALFADGSYEGEVQPAAQAAAYYEGYRIGLARMLELIRHAAASPDVEDPAAVVRFIGRVRDLNRDVEQAVADRVLYNYPELPEGERAGIRSAVEVPLSWLRQSVLSQLTPLERVVAGAAGGPGFRRWLKGTEKSFDEWLARLSR